MEKPSKKSRAKDEPPNRFYAEDGSMEFMKATPLTAEDRAELDAMLALLGVQDQKKGQTRKTRGKK
jgi:hypothetical protein